MMASQQRPAGAGLQARIAAQASECCSSVTVLYARRRLDLVLPSAVPFAELLPTMLRLLVPDIAYGTNGATENRQHTEPASDAGTNGVSELVVWQLARVGGAPLGSSETLDEAGVLDGDLLELRQGAGSHSVIAGRSMRDRVEELVSDQDRFWTQRTSRAFLHGAVLAVAAGLLIPVALLPLGIAVAGLAGTLAGLLSVTAATLSSRSASLCASLALLLGCAWAFLAGATALICQVTDTAGSTRTTATAVTDIFARSGPIRGGPNDPVAVNAAAIQAIAAGALAALLLMICSIAIQSALVYLTALAVVAFTLLVVVVAGLLGLPVIGSVDVVVVTAVLAMGCLPRAALLAGGLANARITGEMAVFDARFVRSDRMLTGGLVGVSVVVAVGSILFSVTGDRLQQLLAAGAGLTLLLRSRALSQVPHAIGPRIAGLIILAALGVASYRGASHIEQGMLLVAAAGSVAAATATAGRIPAHGSIGRARASRLLSIVEHLLVVMLVLLAAGANGLFDWTSQVMR